MDSSKHFAAKVFNETNREGKVCTVGFGDLPH
jgi:hypothetical protein